MDDFSTGSGSVDSGASSGVSTPVSSPTPSAPTSTPSPASPSSTQYSQPETTPVAPVEHQQVENEQYNEQYTEEPQQEVQLGTQQFASLEDALAHIEQLSQQYEPYMQTHNRIEEFGGLDTVETLLQLAGSMFSPLMNEVGEQMQDYRGLPEFTAAPFVDQMAEISQGTLFEIAARAMDAPFGNSGESLGHVFCREVLGINPELLGTYQQIQSLEQAQSFMPVDISVDPADLAMINPQFHQAFKSLDPELRDEVLGMTDANRDKVLAACESQLESQRLNEENQRYIAEQRQLQQKQWNDQVAQAGDNLISQVRDNSINSAFEDLKAKANFFGNEVDNQVAWNDIIVSSANKITTDPAAASEITKAEDFYKASAYYDAIGERWKAQQFKVEADRISKKLDLRFKNEVTTRTKWWSQKLGATVNQQPKTQPRVELGKQPSMQAPMDVTPKAPSRTEATHPTGIRFGLSPAQINAMASQLAMKRAGHA